MEWERTAENQKGRLNSSDSIFREDSHGNGESLTGYRPSAAEKINKDVPEQVACLRNSYGSVSVGMNKKQEAIVQITQNRTRDIHELPKESKELEGQTATSLPIRQDKFKVNENKQQESSIQYRSSKNKPGASMVKNLQKMFNNNNFQVQEELLPSMTLKKDKEKLTQLWRLKQEAILEKNNLQEHIDQLDSHIGREEEQLETISNRFDEISQKVKKEKVKDFFLLSLIANVLSDFVDDDDDTEDEKKKKGKK